MGHGARSLVRVDIQFPSCYNVFVEGIEALLFSKQRTAIHGNAQSFDKIRKNVNSSFLLGDGMKEIQLNKGFVTQVSDEDYEYLNQWKWRISTKRRAIRTKGKITIYMHRVIMNAPDGMEVDHIDRTPLNNQRENLRLCTRSENTKNYTIPKTNTSGFMGVSLKKPSSRLAAYICVKGRLTHLGYFDTAEEAAHVRDCAYVKYYGKFARLNFPEEWINRDKEFDS